MKHFHFCFLFFFIMMSQMLSAQQITNIHFEQVGKQIQIYYDLQGEETYTVQVFCSTDNGQTWGKPLQKVSGAVGEGQKSGKVKLIIWDVLEEREKLSGEVSFKIEATDAAWSTNIEMVFVKGDTFKMGSNKGERDEKPIHTVTVSDFYIGKYEINQKQWQEVMGSNPSKFKGCDECPVERVSWNDVQEFIKKLNRKTGKNYRLPTEAEWEFAARGGNQSNGYTYCGSNNNKDVAWYFSNSKRKTHEVGTKAANELGIHDMSGNVWEWCNDWYSSGYYGSNAQNNPQGPSSGTDRVLRGGSWSGYADGCRVANRGSGSPDDASGDGGFRIAR